MADTASSDGSAEPATMLEEKRNVIAQAIVGLNERHEHLTDALTWFEGQYVKDPSKDRIEIETKEYLIDALNTVATDVQTISQNLDQFLELQNEAVEGLSTSLQSANSRLRMLKEQHGAARFAVMRQDHRVSSSEVAMEELETGEAQPYQRVALADKLRAVSSTGISLVNDAPGSVSTRRPSSAAAPTPPRNLSTM